MMNTGPAGVSGRVVEMCVADGALVEYGDVLFRLGLGVTRVLVANRGEIAVRIVNACRRLGFRVGGRGQRGRPGLAGGAAGRTVRSCIGPAPAAQSYLRPELLAQAAVSVGADIAAPRLRVLQREGRARRDAARRRGSRSPGPGRKPCGRSATRAPPGAVAVAAGVPVAPGARRRTTLPALPRRPPRIGYPVLLKAVFGGGGRGIHLVDDAGRSSPGCWTLAAAEARAGFGDGALYVEKFYGAARHVEVQVFGDGEGEVRDRRRSRLLGATPAPEADRGVPGPRAQHRPPAPCCTTAPAGSATHLRYRGAGTVEFLVDTASAGDPADRGLPRGQRPHPGRAPGDRGGVRRRPGRRPAAAGRRAARTGSRSSRPCRRRTSSSAAHRRGSRRGLPAHPGPDHAAWSSRAGPGVRVDTHVFDGLPVPAVLRQPAGQAHRPGARPGQPLSTPCSPPLSATRVDGVSTARPCTGPSWPTPTSAPAGSPPAGWPAAWPPPTRRLERRNDSPAPCRLVDTSTRDGNQSLWGAAGLTTGHGRGPRPAPGSGRVRRTRLHLVHPPVGRRALAPARTRGSASPGCAPRYPSTPL